MKAIRTNPGTVPFAVASIVAQEFMMSSETTEEVFGFPKEEFKNGKKGKNNGKDNRAAKPQGKPSKPGGSETNTCSLDRSDPGNFKAVNTNYYFMGTRKYAALDCLSCKKPFASDGNKQKNGYGHAIGLPTSKLAAHVCISFEVDKCACGSILCNDCYVALLNAAPATRKRGRRDAGGANKRAKSSKM